MMEGEERGRLKWRTWELVIGEMSIFEPKKAGERSWGWGVMRIRRGGRGPVGRGFWRGFRRLGLAS